MFTTELSNKTMHFWKKKSIWFKRREPFWGIQKYLEHIWKKFRGPPGHFYIVNSLQFFPPSLFKHGWPHPGIRVPPNCRHPIFLHCEMFLLPRSPSSIPPSLHPPTNTFGPAWNFNFFLQQKWLSQRFVLGQLLLSNFQLSISVLIFLLNC